MEIVEFSNKTNVQKKESPKFDLSNIEQLAKTVELLKCQKYDMTETVAYAINNAIKVANIITEQPNLVSKDSDIFCEISNKLNIGLHEINPMKLSGILDCYELFQDPLIKFDFNMPEYSNDIIILYSYQMELYIYMDYNYYKESFYYDYIHVPDVSETIKNIDRIKKETRKIEKEIIDKKKYGLFAEVIPTECEQILTLQYSNFIDIDILINSMLKINKTKYNIVDKEKVYINYISKNIIFPNIKGTYDQLKQKVNIVIDEICQKIICQNSIMYKKSIRQNQLIDNSHILVALNSYNTENIVTKKKANFHYIINCRSNIGNNKYDGNKENESVEKWIINNKPKNKQTTKNYYEEYKQQFGDYSLHVNQFGPLVKKIVPQIIIRKNKERFYTYS